MRSANQYVLVSPLTYGGQADFAFTYQTSFTLSPGQIVSIPLRQTQSLGVVIGPTKSPPFKTKSITSVSELQLPPHLVKLASWIHQFYQATPKAIWQTILPSGLTKKRRDPKPLKTQFKLTRPKHQLSSDQQAALQAIRQNKPKPILIHGITGSGKTEVYLQLAAETLGNGQSIIVLVPEITLAPQLVALFTDTFGDIVVATHSRMTEAERHRAWQTSLQSQEPRIIIGPRSCLFLPLRNPGLIIIDECHETSYKQEQSPRYQADAVAGQLAKLTGAQLILGSATPSLNQYFWAEHNRLKLVKLTSRPNHMPLPQTTIVDLRNKDNLSSSRFISKPLLSALTSSLQDNRQSLLFINRRGSAASQICSDCGTVSLCPNCQLPLTFHADNLALMCHYCNFTRPPAAVCTSCSSMNLRYLGGGTKRIERDITELLPTARLARLDKDSATPDHIDAVYRGLHNHTIDILIGTQMVAKGLNLPNLDVVGVISADTMLHLPDFSASERTFNLITQVSGRAGRGTRPGQVIIQTYSPTHPAITTSAIHDYTSFASNELSQRRLINYPPFVYLLKLTCSSRTSETSQAKAADLAKRLKTQSGLQVLGPAPAFIERSKGGFVWHLILKSRQRSTLVEVVRHLPSTDWTADLDPVNLL